MENFIVSARKYRPQQFDTVVGQSHITDTLEHAIEENQLAQALLFCGPRGVMKRTDQFRRTVLPTTFMNWMPHRITLWMISEN
jgi:hypothetical protein